MVGRGTDAWQDDAMARDDSDAAPRPSGLDGAIEADVLALQRSCCKAGGKRATGLPHGETGDGPTVMKTTNRRARRLSPLPDKTLLGQQTTKGNTDGELRW